MFLDPFFLDASRQAARWCAETGIPYVTVAAPPDSEIARGAEVLVISEEFTASTFETSEPREVLAAYVERCGGLVILIRVSKRLLYGRRGEQPREYQPFSVEPRDTTGAGDSLRAGIIYRILPGYADEGLVRTASAVAALVCQRLPAIVNCPSEKELVVQLAEEGQHRDGGPFRHLRRVGRSVRSTSVAPTPGAREVSGVNPPKRGLWRPAPAPGLGVAVR